MAAVDAKFINLQHVKTTSNESIVVYWNHVESSSNELLDAGRPFSKAEKLGTFLRVLRSEYENVANLIWMYEKSYTESVSHLIIEER